MKKLTELTEEQTEIYKLRTVAAAQGVKEDRIFNYTIELYHIIHKRDGKLMKQKDYEIVRKMQDA